MTKRDLVIEPEDELFSLPAHPNSGLERER